MQSLKWIYEVETEMGCEIEAMIQMSLTCYCLLPQGRLRVQQQSDSFVHLG